MSVRTSSAWTSASGCSSRSRNFSGGSTKTPTVSDASAQLQPSRSASSPGHALPVRRRDPTQPFWSWAPDHRRQIPNRAAEAGARSASRDRARRGAHGRCAAGGRRRRARRSPCSLPVRRDRCGRPAPPGPLARAASSTRRRRSAVGKSCGPHVRDDRSRVNRGRVLRRPSRDCRGSSTEVGDSRGDRRAQDEADRIGDGASLWRPIRPRSRRARPAQGSPALLLAPSKGEVRAGNQAPHR